MLAIFSWLIIYTINPNLVNFNFGKTQNNGPQVVDTNTTTPQKYYFNNAIPPSGSWYLQITGRPYEGSSTQTFYYGPFDSEEACTADRQDPTTINWGDSSSCVKK